MEATGEVGRWGRPGREELGVLLLPAVSLQAWGWVLKAAKVGEEREGDQLSPPPSWRCCCCWGGGASVGEDMGLGGSSQGWYRAGLGARLMEVVGLWW